MSSRFFTNHGEQTLLKKFQGVFESNTDIEFFDALVGYLRASGYFAIRPFLGNVPHIRILVGINVDAIMAAVPWEESEKKMTVPKQAKTVRGKLNVPRERFRLRETGYVWAGIQ